MSMLFLSENRSEAPPTVEDVYHLLSAKLLLAVSEQGGYGLDTRVGASPRRPAPVMLHHTHNASFNFLSKSKLNGGGAGAGAGSAMRREVRGRVMT